MLNRVHFAVATLGLAAMTTATQAAPFSPADVPADAQYVLHVDMDALRPTRLFHAINDRLVGNETFSSKMGLFEQGSGMHFPRDLHGLTVFGKAPGDEAAVTIIRAKMNRAQFMAALENFATNYAAETFGKYDIAGWDDDQRRLYGVFHDDNTLLFARSLDNIKAALDVLDTRSPHVAPADALAAGAKQPALAYVAVTNLSTVQLPDNRPTPAPVKQLNSGWLTLAEHLRPTTQPAATEPNADNSAADKLADTTLHVTLNAKSPEAANRLSVAASGLRAMVSFAAMSDTADDKVKLGAALLQNLNVKQTGNDITGDLTTTVDQLNQLADHLTPDR